MTKTILKWAGNKSKVMQKISPFFGSNYNRYLEPFAGSLGSYLHSGVNVKDVFLNDLNSEIINLSNVPFGSGRKGNVLSLSEAEAFSKAIKDVNFSCMGYLDFLEIAQSGDLIYLDPPYVDTKDPKKEFNGYVGGFGWTEQKELITECKRLKELNCRVIVSNSYCNETLELYKDFEINIIEAPRYISCKKDGRKPVKEIVAVLK